YEAETGKVHSMNAAFNTVKEEDDPLFSCYLRIHCYTPSVDSNAVDDIAEGQLLDYIQNPNPVFSWLVSDQDSLDLQNDFQNELYENEDLSQFIWQTKHTENINILDNGTSTTTRPFGTMNEMRFQYKYMNSLLNHSGMVDKLHFGINSTDASITLDYLIIQMANTPAPGALGFDFDANINDGNPVEVLRAESYVASIVNNTIEFDIENIFLLNQQMNLIIEVRYNTSSSDEISSFYNSAAYGSVAYAWGTDAYTASTATTLETNAFDIKVELATDEVFSNATLSATKSFGSASNSSGKLLMKYNSSLFQDSGLIDRIYFQVGAGSGDITLDNLSVTLAETSLDGQLSHEQLSSNYAGEDSIIVLTKDNFTLRNIDGFLILDVEDVFFYTGAENLLIELEWDSQIGDVDAYVMNNTGGYTAWNYAGNTTEDANTTWAYAVYFDFIHNESSITYDGPTLVEEQEYLLRIRVADSTGIWSEWNEIVFIYHPLVEGPDFEGPIVKPSPVPLGSEVEVSINVTHFLGVYQVLIEYGGTNRSMTEDDSTYSHSWTPSTAELVYFTIYMESAVRTWSTVDGSFTVMGDEPVESESMLLYIVSGGAIIVCIVAVVIVRKRKAMKEL
ncbi:MAG: hypothetical protein ACFFEE_08650, partial [Candidatus Thorarchaeota archaeon]